MKSKAGQETRPRIYWGWNAGKGWTAPDGDPRWTFTAGRHAPVLYKLYVSRHLVHRPSRARRSLSELSPALLPEMDQGLIAPGS